jgi:hypothetical protein
MKVFKTVIMRILFLIAICCGLWSCQSEESYDIVVYGGTPGGVTAAIQSAKLGKRVLLIEPSKHIGGIMTNGLGVTDIDSQKAFQNSVAVGGLALEYYLRIADYYDRRQAFDSILLHGIKNHDFWPHEPHVGEKILLDWLEEHHVPILTQARLVESDQAVQKSGSEIQQIQLEDGKTIRAKVFIDATYEGDLLAAAGIDHAIGRESSETYGEHLNGIQAETTHAQFAVKVDPYKIPGDSTSGLIPFIQEGGLGTPGSADKHIQAYCFRACLTPNPNNQVPFHKPDGYDRSMYEIYVRYLEAGGNLLWPWVSVPNQKSDLGAWHDLSHNMYGLNADYPGGDYATRKRIYDEHRFYTTGLFYFFATDTAVGRLRPDFQKEWASWGYAKDEFQDNDHFPHQFYVRSGRRMISDYIITQHHILTPNPIEVEDPIGVAFWPPDVHSARRIVKDGYAYNEGFVFEPFGNWRPLPISYRALVPKRNQCTNLLTATCPSSSYIAYGSIRLEWTFMVMGQSVANAAALAIDQNVSVQDVPYDTLKNILLGQNQVLQLP